MSDDKKKPVDFQPLLEYLFPSELLKATFYGAHDESISAYKLLMETAARRGKILRGKKK